MKRRPIWVQDLYFLYKYGFLFVYVIFTICYILVIQAVAVSYRETMMILLVYTDPAGMGLFLMGALVLLEKSQRVQNALAVSPLPVSTYVRGKVTSFLIIGEVVAVSIAVSCHYQNMAWLMIGVGLGSLMYSVFGMMLAVHAKSLNHFLLISIAVELFLTVPGVLHIFQKEHPLLTINPGVMIVKLMEGSSSQPLLLAVILIAEIAFCLILCNRMTERSFQKLGGVKL